MPPLGILMERFPAFLFNPLENYSIGCYLSIEPIIFQECIGHLYLARSLFQSHILGGYRASQAIRENLAKQGVIVSIGFHLPIEHAHIGPRISNTIISNKLECLELGRHNDLWKIGQIV